jgi:hypothetical protein
MIPERISERGLLSQGIPNGGAFMKFRVADERVRGMPRRGI